MGEEFDRFYRWKPGRFCFTRKLKKFENHLFKPKLSAPNPLWAIASGLLLSKPVRNLPKAPGVQKWWEPFERHKKMVKACSMFGEETVMLKWTLMHLQQWSNTNMDSCSVKKKHQWHEPWNSGWFTRIFIAWLTAVPKWQFFHLRCKLNQQLFWSHRRYTSQDAIVPNNDRTAEVLLPENPTGMSSE